MERYPIDINAGYLLFNLSFTENSLFIEPINFFARFRAFIDDLWRTTVQ